MNDSSTRWIIGSVAAALWASTVIAAMTDIHMRWYLAILAAAVVASLAALACVIDAAAKAREVRRSEAGRAALHHCTDQMLAAIDQHAGRMEVAVNSHVGRLEGSVFTAERWMTNGWRAERIAQMDAAEARAAQKGDETGPLPMIFGRSR